MAQDPRLTELLRQLSTELGFRAMTLEPSALLAAAEKSLSETLRTTLKEVLQDSESELTQLLTDKFYEQLDDDAIIAAIAKPLAESLLAHIKENPDDLINALVDELVENHLDIDEIKDLVAEKVANRIKMQ